jgi:hypothetical protein
LGTNHPARRSRRSGLLTSKDFQIWLDWMVKDGQLGAGQVSASEVFSNRLNPFAI